MQTIRKYMGLAAVLAVTPAALAGVQGGSDNRNGMISVWNGNSGTDPAEYSFNIDPSEKYLPKNIDQTVQLSNRVAHLVHNSDWLGADPGSVTTGFTVTETYTTTKPTGPGYAHASEHTSISFHVTGAPAAGFPWNFSGSLTENGADAVIQLVGPGVNQTFSTTSTWDTAVAFKNGDYTLTIDTDFGVNARESGSKSIVLSVTLLDESPSALTSVAIDPGNGHRYQLVSPTTWESYKDFADASNSGGVNGTYGCPVAINSANENTWVRANLANNVPGLPDYRNLHIGFTDQAVEGTWEWWCLNGASYTNWLAGEPDNTGNQDWAELRGNNGQWVSRAASVVNQGVTEFAYIQCGSGGGCFSVHAAGGCNDESCCQTVCFVDSFCCNNSWDVTCVDEANALCTPPVIAGPIFNPATGSHYYLLATAAWSEAEARAIGLLGGHLATINSAAENTWVLNNVSRFDGNTTRVCFIGFTDQIIEGSFQWLDFSPSTYTNWNAGEPNNSNGNEHYAEILANGKWNDDDNTGGAGYTTFAIVEVPCVGDIDGNGTVNAADLGVVLGAWGGNAPNADLNHDGLVDASDLAVVLGAWGNCPA